MRGVSAARRSLRGYGTLTLRGVGRALSRCTGRGPGAYTASAVKRRVDGGAQQLQPPGWARMGDGAAAAILALPPSAGALRTARGAEAPQVGQGCGRANSAIGRTSLNGPQLAQL